MSVQLQELIDRIKREGVQEAEKQAADMKGQAQTEADRIVSEAKKQAQTIVKKAKEETRQFEAASRDSLAQAGRDLVLNVKKNLTDLFQAVLRRETAGGLDSDVLREALLALIKGWADRKGESGEILIPEKQQSDVVDYVMSRVAKELKGGFEIRPSARIEAGFKISEGDAFYDFTDRGIAEFLMEHLNSKVAACLKGQED